MDIIGMKIGRLTVVGNSSRKGYVVCECSCGNTKTIRSNSLTMNNPVQSCGCIQRETARSHGSELARKNFASFYADSVKYNTNFHVIESNRLCSTNKSGVTGVWFNEKRGLWEAYISVHKKRIFLGRYGKKEDAIHARKTAEEEYFKPLIQMKNEGAE